MTARALTNIGSTIVLVVLLVAGTSLAPASARPLVDVQADEDADAEYVALSLEGNATADWPLAVSGTGDARTSDIAVSGTGDASCDFSSCIAVSGTGNASCSSSLCVALGGGNPSLSWMSVPRYAPGILPYASLLTEPAPYEKITAPWDLSGPGTHAIVHYDVKPEHLPRPARVILFTLETPDGDPVMHARLSSHDLYITDGYDEEGEVRWTKPFQPRDGQGARLDVHVEGDTYTLTGADRFDPEQLTEVTARTFTPASEVMFGDREALQEEYYGSGGDSFSHHRAALLPDGSSATTFLGGPDQTGWGTVTTEFGETQTQTGSRGDHSQARFRATGGAGFNGPDVDEAAEDLEDRASRAGSGSVDDTLAYIAHPVPDGEGAYFAQASARPLDATLARLGGVPDHQAALAGVSGPREEPEVNWAIVVAQAPYRGPVFGMDIGEAHPPVDRYDTWSLYLIGPDDSRTQIAPSWGPFEPLWHRVSVLVDEEAGSLTVQVDGEDPALGFTFDDLGSSERIATGDVWVDHPLWTGGETGYYDNVAVAPSGIDGS